MNRNGRPFTALFSFTVALFLLVASVATLRGSAMPEGSRAVVWAVWWLSVAALTAGIVLAARDLWILFVEQSAIAHVQPGWIDTPAVIPSNLRGTVAADRARMIGQILARRSGAEHARPLLRSRAVGRFSRFGSTTRFIASCLLLLAVIGTFVGMKTAIPNLAIAIGQSTAATAGNSASPGKPSGIQDALSQVSNAFGANFLAILGSLALGIAAFGAAADARRLLLALDQASEARLYVRLPMGADTTAIERVIGELRSSLGEVAAVAGGVAELRSAIASFEGSLGHAISGLQSAFTSGFQRSIIESQSRLAHEVTALTVSVAEVSKSLQESAKAHQALVAEAEARDAIIRDGVSALAQSGSRISSALEGATARLNTASDRMAASAEAQEQTRQGIAASASSLDRVADLVGRAIDGNKTELEELRRVHARVAAGLSDNAERSLAAIENASRGAGSALDRIEAAALRSEKLVASGITALDERDREIQRTLGSLSGSAQATVAATQSLVNTTADVTKVMNADTVARIDRSVGALTTTLRELNERIRGSSGGPGPVSPRDGRTDGWWPFKRSE